MKRNAWAQEIDNELRDDPEYIAAGMIIDITEQVSARMKFMNITQKELAQRLGTTQPNISKLLSGAENLTMKTLATLAVALDAHWEAPRLVAGCGDEFNNAWRKTLGDLAEYMQAPTLPCVEGKDNEQFPLAA